MDTPIHRVRFSCEECRDEDSLICPYCGHNCDLRSITIRSDEDCYCDRCHKDCLQSLDGLRLCKHGQEPRFLHDCQSCVYLGQDQEHDFYFCPQGSLPTVIARWSSHGPDYSSGLEIALSIERAKPEAPLVKALKLARDAKLVPSESR